MSERQVREVSGPENRFPDRVQILQNLRESIPGRTVSQPAPQGIFYGLSRTVATSSVLTSPPSFPNEFNTNVMILETSESERCIDGMTPSYSTPLTVMGALRPNSTTPMARSRSALRKSEFRSARERAFDSPAIRLMTGRTVLRVQSPAGFHFLLEVQAPLARNPHQSESPEWLRPQVNKRSRPGGPYRYPV